MQKAFPMDLFRQVIAAAVAIAEEPGIKPRWKQGEMREIYIMRRVAREEVGVWVVGQILNFLVEKECMKRRLDTNDSERWVYSFTPEGLEFCKSFVQS